jgi:hypothetical protein
VPFVDGVDVQEGEMGRVFVDAGAGDGSLDDLAEYATG